MKEIVRKQIKEHQQGKDAALTELESLPQCITPDCSDCHVNQIISKTPSPMPEEPQTLVNNPPIITKNSESIEDNPLLKRKPKKKGRNLRIRRMTLSSLKKPRDLLLLPLVNQSPQLIVFRISNPMLKNKLNRNKYPRIPPPLSPFPLFISK
ncbi:hypothetical protein TNCT_44071 [Trichonephila clavata]|uniref:Uncharacterized protein n=1 Tax=Trichonephila clavata TaxID=2740835 RepID=A0A8X6IEE7_TRICU|nr:hypothetical protein TNCT_44071 [Trichonephila clavata]